MTQDEARDQVIALFTGVYDRSWLIEMLTSLILRAYHQGSVDALESAIKELQK